MGTKTTKEMVDALAEAARSLKKIDDMLSDVMPVSTVEKFWERIRMTPMKPDQADEYFGALTHSTKAIREDIDGMLRELGSAQHIIEAAVHKAAAGGPRKHLML